MYLRKQVLVIYFRSIAPPADCRVPTPADLATLNGKGKR